MYCLNMLAIALELAREDAIYEDIATKFFEHFVYIGAAVNRMGGREGGLWDEDDGYYFDALKLLTAAAFRSSAHTIAGVIPVFAIAIGDREQPADVSRLRASDSAGSRGIGRSCCAGSADMTHRGVEERIRLALVDSHELRRILEHVLDEAGMLSPHGVRSVSKRHAADPFVLELDGQRFVLDYEPGESTTPLFGGNSNWRGPVWFPINFLLIEALQKHHYFLGDEFKVECPTGSGNQASLWEVTTDLSYRLIGLFLRDDSGRRPVNGDREKFRQRSALARPRSVPRIFPRRHRRRSRRQPSDGLDRHRRQADPAVRRVCAAEQAAESHRGRRDRRGTAFAVTIALPLDAEWLESDAIGGFASGTVAGYRTRRYHALLLTPRRPPTDRDRPGQRSRSVGRHGRGHLPAVDAALRARRNPPARHRSPGGFRARALADVDILRLGRLRDRPGNSRRSRGRQRAPRVARACAATASRGSTCARSCPGAIITR